MDLETWQIRSWLPPDNSHSNTGHIGGFRLEKYANAGNGYSRSGLG